MNANRFLRAFVGAVAVATVAGLPSCVGDRPSRNGVFDENQYLRKSFLVTPGTGGATDPGWFLKATVVQTSTPNPLATAFLFNGAENSADYGGNLVRFIITSDRLQLADMREISEDADIAAQSTRTPAIVNAWPITNVDLKYRINLNGERTNFYEENQELDWQERQWVKLTLDKNDFSDLASLGPFQSLMLNKCTDGANASATLVPGSFLVDEPNNYLQWTLQITLAVRLDDPNCMTQFGSVGTEFVRLGRSTVTANVLVSMVRATPVDPSSYTPLVIAEKDPILHKYGPLHVTNWSRDYQTGLLAARQLVTRFNPNAPIVFYFAPGFPDPMKATWKGIAAQTNAIFKKIGAKARVTFLDYDDATTLGDGKGPARQFGDIRYNFLRWISDLDAGAPGVGTIGATQQQTDLRTGRLLSASINFYNFPLRDFLSQHLQAYMEAVVGYNPSDPTTDLFATPPPDPANPGQFLAASCQSGQTIPLATAALHSNIYAQSTLYQKMAQYMPAPANGSATPGPSDWVFDHVGDPGKTFYQSYFALLPYITYADPALNGFVTPADLGDPPAVRSFTSLLSGETAFQSLVSDIDHGKGGLENATPGAAGMTALFKTIDDFRTKWQAHRDYVYGWKVLPYSNARADTTDLISFNALASRGSRLCVNGAWETQEQWTERIVQSYWDRTMWHEFGHVLGLEHNFMGSVDKASWPTYSAADGATQYGAYTSSVMEYEQAWDGTAWNNGKAGQEGWLPYDQGAIAFNYGNNLSAASAGPVAPTTGGGAPGISGQISATAPWKDPYGWSGQNELQFLYCGPQHERYTPLCREHDVGVTPSEITAAEIESYDWNYRWRNFRNYYKSWDVSSYGGAVADYFSEFRRFLAMSAWDWSPSEITDKLIRIGVAPPSGAPNAGLFYSQLAAEFTSDVGAAAQLIAGFHEAVIQQSTGQRPYVTQYDPYNGDVTQQGVSIDKQTALTNWLGLWPYDNYDPSQANGFYASSLTLGPNQFGQGQSGPTPPPPPAQAWSAASSMLGEKGVWDAYPGYFPAAVALFAHDTQTATFIGDSYPQLRYWVGGHAFSVQAYALAYFQNIAFKNPKSSVWAGDPLANAANGGNEGCSSLATCTYNPMLPQQSIVDIGHSNPTTGAFVGPDDRRWVWMYIPDRNVWVFADQDENPSLYFQIYTYNKDLNTSFCDGNNCPIFKELARIEYMIDAYGAFGGDTQEAQ